MNISLYGLIIDRSLQKAKNLKNILHPEIPLEDFEYAKSIDKALKAAEKAFYHTVFVSDDFDLDSIAPLFAGLRKNKRYRKGTLIVRVFDKKIEDSSASFDAGFHFRILRSIEPEDKDQLVNLVKHFYDPDTPERVIPIGETLPRNKTQAQKNPDTTVLFADEKTDEKVEASQIEITPKESNAPAPGAQMHFNISEFEQDEVRVLAAERRVRSKLAKIKINFKNLDTAREKK